MENRRGEIMFVSAICTAWHLIGLKAYLLKMGEKNSKTVEGLVFIDKHPVNGYLIKDDMLNFEFNVICHCVYGGGTDNILKELEKYQRLASELCVITAFFPEVILCDKIATRYSIKTRSIVIDEGVGSYDTSLVRWAKSVFIDTKKLHDAFYFVGRQMYQKALQMIKGIKVEKFMIFINDNGSLKENGKVVKYYKKLMNLTDGEPIDIQEDKYILFFTNPLEEEENVSREDLVKVYSGIISLCSNLGYKVLFRLHPRETLTDKYIDFKIVTANASSSEDLLNRLTKKPDFVIGAHSTSLVTAKLFYDIPAITIGKMLYPYSKTNFCRHLIDKYNENFCEIVYTPASLKDLKNIL